MYPLIQLKSLIRAAFILIAGVHYIPLQLSSQSSDSDDIVNLTPMEIIADRAFGLNLGIPAAILIGDVNTSLSLDQALRRLSSVDTFRSIDSFTAHPTTQGVRFRHTATNATSRALVLVDGVPQNDPFGGWIYWNKLPLESIQSLEVFPIGSVPAWGNYSSGGAIHLITASPNREQTRFSVQGGSFGTLKASLHHTAPISDSLGISVEGRIFSTDGYKVVRPDQRGPVDKASKSDYEYLRLQLAQQINEMWSWALTGQYFSEDRINGTLLSPNSTDSTDLSWSLSRDGGTGAGFNLVAFYQDRDFQNIFSSVAADRNSERQVLNQYSVPAEALGGQATWFWEGDGYVNFLAGGDFRQAEGSANELTRNLGAGFTRERQEGGDQSFVGAFLTIQTLPDQDSSLEGTIRFDHWNQENGFRKEFNLETGAQTRDTQYPHKSGDVVSLNAKYNRQLDPNWSISGLAFSGFRAPTLNELYRPFRVRNDITESNPDLRKETSTGGELSLHYQDEANTLQLSVFYYSLDDMVTNVFLHNDTGFDALCGFVPGGGSCNQRRNVEDSEVQGLEVAWQWDPGADVEFLLNYTFSNTEFKRSTGQPAIEGNRFPLSPRHKLTSQILWHFGENLDFIAQYHYRSTHFDNVLNTRKIGSSTVLNLGAQYQVPESPWAFRVQVDNVLDEDITTAISSSGIYTQAAPINAWISASYER
ncbi:MAG: TonB-dependent receptor [Verrucomicrobia bacterium]|nr:TonB-dependent receptor [Verrucomicrobiota bacterium]